MSNQILTQLALYTKRAGYLELVAGYRTLIYGSGSPCEFLLSNEPLRQDVSDQSGLSLALRLTATYHGERDNHQHEGESIPRCGTIAIPDDKLYFRIQRLDIF